MDFFQKVDSSKSGMFRWETECIHVLCEIIFFVIFIKDKINLFADVFGGISGEWFISSCVIEVGHSFVNVVYSILYNYSGAFVGFVDDYVCIFTEFVECSLLPEGEIGLDSDIAR